MSFDVEAARGLVQYARRYFLPSVTPPDGRKLTDELDAACDEIERLRLMVQRRDALLDEMGKEISGRDLAARTAVRWADPEWRRSTDCDL